MRALAVFVVAAALWAPSLPADASAQTASSRAVVLTIHLGAETFPSNPVLDAGIREALAARPDVEIDYFAEYLEADLFPAEQASQAFADYIRGKYHGRRIGVVIASTELALRFALAHRGNLFPDAPIVYSGVDVPEESARTAGQGLTGIRVGVAYAETLKLALELHPSTERVFVVARAADDRRLEPVRAAFGSVSGRVNVTFLTEPTVTRLLSAVRAIPPGSVIVYVWHASQDEPGNVAYADDVAQLVAQAAPVPVYGTSDFYVGRGLVGGVVRSTRGTGTRLGELALSVLTGTRPQDIPIEAAKVAPVLDWRQVVRWGIAPARVPAGSQILFREPSTWERFRVYILGAVAALLVQSALIAVLLVQRAKRREAEQLALRSESALSKSHEHVRDLGSRLLNAQEHERSRIAGELHDDISQQLAGLRIHLSKLRRTVQGPAEAVTAEAMQRTADIAMSVHDLSHRLHPSKLRLMGLVAGVEGLRSELSSRDLDITFAHADVPPALPPDLTVCLFRIVQEALHNALKHSRARTVSVDLRGASEGVSLTIVDDGVGFDVDAAWGRGLGLISVHERVEAIGGTFEIRSRPGAGTWLLVGVPASVLHDTTAVVA